MAEDEHDSDGFWYTVAPGDCIDSIGFDHGLHWDTIWKDTHNRQLRELRKNPNILLPGDEVYIPNICVRKESRPTDQTHTFVRRGVPSTLSIVLRDRAGNPRPNTPYVLVIDSAHTSGKTDGEGTLRFTVPSNAKRGSLRVEGPAGQEVYPLLLGNVDPIDTCSGVQERLTNLGFYVGSPTGEMDESTRQAIRDFQEFHNLPVSGQVDQATQDKLKSEFGC